MKKLFKSLEKMKNFQLILSAIALSLFGCNSEDAKVSNKTSDESSHFETVNLPLKVAVNPVYDDVDVPFQTFGISTESDTTITFGKMNTKISIPAGCFVHQDGSPVLGKVDIDYREIRTAAEIILSGITMVYDSAGQSYDFQTAGMFDIRGKKNGEPIKFADGKSIKIDYDSEQTDGDYNFYCLDEKQANWDYLSRPLVSLNPMENSPISKKSKFLNNSNPNNNAIKKEAPLKSDSIKNLIPVKPHLANNDQEIWDFEYNLTSYPQFKQYAGVMWQYAGDESNNPLNVDPNLIWKPVKIEAIDESKGIYNLDLKAKGKSLSMKMKPVYMGKHYKFAQKEYEKKLAAYKAAKQKELADRKLLAQIEANGGFLNKRAERRQQRRVRRATRSMNIQQFGIYNCDRYGRVKSVKNLIAKIDTILNEGEEVKPRIFVVASQGTVIVNWGKLINTSQFRYSMAEDNKLVVLYPGKKVATFSSKAFEKLKVNSNNSIDNPYLFETTLHDALIKGPEDLEEILNSI